MTGFSVTMHLPFRFEVLPQPGPATVRNCQEKLRRSGGSGGAGGRPWSLVMKRIVCSVLLLTALAAPGLAQSGDWPDWAARAFGLRPGPGSGWREAEPDIDRDFVPKTRPWGEPVRDGGPRPAISPQAPPIVDFHYAYTANSIVIDVSGRKLYYVLADNRAYAYPIGVGREGFGWTGTEKISRKQAWPDWHPPAEMRERDPSLPEKMTGGVRNPLGAVALYLGNTLYRIHGTNDARSIGKAQSSGCFRMMNSAALHLAQIAQIGTTVAVVQSLSSGPRVSRASSGTKSVMTSSPDRSAREASPAPQPLAAPAASPAPEAAPTPAPASAPEPTRENR